MTAALLVALHEALDVVDDSGTVDLTSFDADGDMILDAVTFVHSGHVAEWGGRDCNGNAGASSAAMDWARWCLDGCMCHCLSALGKLREHGPGKDWIDLA